MGTDIALTCVQESPAARRLGRAERWLRGYEDRLSRFIPYSELSRLNASAGRPFQVSPLLFEFVRLSLRLAHRSGGVFDPTLLHQIEGAGYDRTFEEIKTGRRVATTAAGPTFRSVRLEEKTRTIALPAGAGIDSGGIGKGYAADRLASILGSPCLVDAGGDIAAHGNPPDAEAWRIGVQDPFRPERDLAMLRVTDRGVATSSTMKRRWQTQMGEAHHLIDPATGAPARTNAAAVSVVAENATMADFHAKVALLKGVEGGLDYLNSEARVEGLIVDNDRQVFRTCALDRYLAASP